MEFIFIFAIILFQIVFIHLPQVVEVVGAFGIDAFMDNKVFAVFFGKQSVSTVRTAQFHGREAVLVRGESCSTDFTEKLVFGAVVFVEKRLRGITAGTGAVIGDVTFRAAADGSDLLTIALFKVRDEIFVSPVLPEVGNKREFINLELLVLRGMGIIKSPLFEGDVSADKSNQPAVLLIKGLNERE